MAGESSRILEQSWNNPKIVSQTVSHWLSESPNSLLHTQLELEARVGIEPTDEAFAEPCLTSWLPRRERTCKINSFCHPCKFNRISVVILFESNRADWQMLRTNVNRRFEAYTRGTIIITLVNRFARRKDNLFPPNPARICAGARCPGIAQTAGSKS